MYKVLTRPNNRQLHHKMEAANNAGCSRRGGHGLKRQPIAPAVTIPSASTLPRGPVVHSSRLNGRTYKLCFFENYYCLYCCCPHNVCSTARLSHRAFIVNYETEYHNDTCARKA